MSDTKKSLENDILYNPIVKFAMEFLMSDTEEFLEAEVKILREDYGHACDISLGFEKRAKVAESEVKRLDKINTKCEEVILDYQKYVDSLNARLAKAQGLKDRPVWIVWGHRANPQGEWNLGISAIATSPEGAKGYSDALRQQEEGKEYPFKVTIEENRLDHLYGFQDLEIAYKLRKSLGGVE